MAEKISKVKQPLSEDQLAALLLLAALLFGAWLRLAPAAAADFPMNDGGMFYSMIHDLRQNNYHLPAFTSYNNLNIPFTYPPLGFYMAGLLADLFHQPDLSMLLWLPAIFSVLTLPAFALLSGSILQTRLKAALATFFYALMPLSMDWFLMGGGLTRGLGQLFLILTCLGAYKLFYQRSPRALLLTTLSGTILVLSHPESALLAVTSAGILWLFSSRSRQTILDALLTGASISLLCAPWLINVLRLHGLEPFMRAAQTSGNSNFLWLSVFPFNFTQETGLALLAALGLLGLFLKVSQRQYLLPAWVIIPFFINPRSSARAAILPLALLAAIYLLDVILPAMRSSHQPKASQLPASLFLGYIIIYLLTSGYTLDLKMIANRLSPDERQALAWIRQNTPKSSSFIILSGEDQMMRDPLQEWFPALSERSSQTTLQGREWLWGENFIQAISSYQELKNCILQNLACIDEQSSRLAISFDHIYLKKGAGQNCVAGQRCTYGQQLLDELIKSSHYQLIYENNSALLFSKR